MRQKEFFLEFLKLSALLTYESQEIDDTSVPDLKLVLKLGYSAKTEQIPSREFTNDTIPRDRELFREMIRR